MEKQQAKQAAPAKLIKARVRPNNRYGTALAGEIVEVEEHDLELVPHCLVSLENEKREEVAAKAVPSSTDRARAEMAGYQKMFRDQHEQLKKNEAVRLVREARDREQAAKKLLGQDQG